MKTDLRIYVIICFSILANIALAQEKRSIEIMATDTESLKPLKYIYNIEMSDPTSNNMYDYNLKNKEENRDSINIKNATTAEVIVLLKKNKFNYSLTEKKGFELSVYYKTGDCISVTMDSVSELQKLYAILKPLKGVKGEMSDVKYESITPYTTKIYQNLYKNALAKASILAKSTGGTLGQLLSVEIPKNPLGDFAELYDQFAVKLKLTQDQTNFKKEVITKMIYKFELK